eukprot:SM000026S08937  [mRNA]  locus=s26:648909:650374:+ [translate_table: standard]
MGKNQQYKQAQRAKMAAHSAGTAPGEEEVNDGFTDGSFHSPEWHAARLASLQTSSTLTWEEWKAKQKEEAKRNEDLAGEESARMREYRMQLDAERQAKLARGRNHADKRPKLADKKDRSDSKRDRSKKKKKDKSRELRKGDKGRKQRKDRQRSESGSESETDESESDERKRKEKRRARRDKDQGRKRRKQQASPGSSSTSSIGRDGGGDDVGRRKENGDKKGAFRLSSFFDAHRDN